MLCHDEAIAEEPAEKMWEWRAELSLTVGPGAVTIESLGTKTEY